MHLIVNFFHNNRLNKHWKKMIQINIEKCNMISFHIREIILIKCKIIFMLFYQSQV